MMKFSLKLSMFLLVSALFLNASPQEKKEVPVDSITRAELRDHIFYLASDALEGRYFGSKGYETAALYGASQFRAAGVESMIPQDFNVAAMVDGVWQPLGEIVNLGDKCPCQPVNSFTFPSTIISDRVRLTATRGQDFPRFMVGIKEVALYGPGLITETAYTDSSLEAEETSYRIIAQDSVGNRSAPSEFPR